MYKPDAMTEDDLISAEWRLAKANLEAQAHMRLIVSNIRERKLRKLQLRLAKLVRRIALRLMTTGGI